MSVAAFMELFNITDVELARFVGKAVLSAGVWVVAEIVAKTGHNWVLNNNKLMKALKKTGISDRKFHAVDAVLDISLYALAFMVTLYIFELTDVIYTVLTAAGVMGIVVGFAVKEIASNAISGLIIKVNQPFREGHYISVEGSESGTVKKVSVYSTELVRSDGIRTTIPNSKLITSTLVNYSTARKRRAEIKVSVAPGTNVKKALEILKKAAEEDERRLETEPVQAFVNEIKDYYVVLELRFWAKRDDFWPAKRDVMLDIADRFKKRKIKLAVPMRRSVTDEYA